MSSGRPTTGSKEGTEQLILPVLPRTVSHERWLSALCTQGADRQQLLVDMRDKSNRLLEGLSHEEETTSKSSMDIDVRGDTDESFEKEADHSVDVTAEQDLSRPLGFGAKAEKCMWLGPMLSRAS